MLRLYRLRLRHIYYSLAGIEKGKWVRQVFPIAGVFFVFTIATKLSFSYLLVGLPGITVFGTEYSSFANSAVIQWSAFYRFVFSIT